jgi:pantothenate kinase
MAPTPEHHEIAAMIDKEVSAYPDTAGGMEQLLLNMYKYMHDFKRIMDTSAPGDMDTLCAQYPHFYRFAKLMEQLAEGIAAGNFDDVLGERQ